MILIVLKYALMYLYSFDISRTVSKFYCNQLVIILLVNIGTLDILTGIIVHHMKIIMMDKIRINKILFSHNISNTYKN